MRLGGFGQVLLVLVQNVKGPRKGNGLFGQLLASSRAFCAPSSPCEPFPNLHDHALAVPAASLFSLLYLVMHSRL